MGFYAAVLNAKPIKHFKLIYISKNNQIMDDKILITNIQRFSLHDGPGIRTTVFLKGCSLHCPWCANPENILSVPEAYEKEGYQGIYGKWFSDSELLEIILRDRMFYNKIVVHNVACAKMPGGVTFSGGEPLLQIEKLESLCKRLKDEGIHICAETALFVPKSLVETAMRYVDLFYVDIKILDEKRCFALLGGKLKCYLDNLNKLFEAKKNIIFRVPVIGGYTDDEWNRRNVIKLMQQFRPLKVELIKEHNLGADKYRSLGKLPLSLDTVTDTDMEMYRYEMIHKTGIETEVCKI